MKEGKGWGVGEGGKHAPGGRVGRNNADLGIQA